jgi:hypothetical protein
MHKHIQAHNIGFLTESFDSEKDPIGPPLFKVDPKTVFDIYKALKSDPQLGREFGDLFITATYFLKKIQENM